MFGKNSGSASHGSASVVELWGGCHDMVNSCRQSRCSSRNPATGSTGTRCPSRSQERRSATSLARTQRSINARPAACHLGRAVGGRGAVRVRRQPETGRGRPACRCDHRAAAGPGQPAAPGPQSAPEPRPHWRAREGRAASAGRPSEVAPLAQPCRASDTDGKVPDGLMLWLPPEPRRSDDTVCATSAKFKSQ